VLILQARIAAPFFVSRLVQNLGIWAFYHTSQTSKSQFRRFETERPSVISRVIIQQREIESVHQDSHQVRKSHCHRARPPSLGWGIMSRMAWSTSTTRKTRKRTMSRCMTLRAAAPCCQCNCQLPLQLPGCTTLRASVQFLCPEARRPTLGRADLLRQPQAPGRLRRNSVTWQRRCLARERHLATKLQSQSVRSVSARTSRKLKPKGKPTAPLGKSYLSEPQISRNWQNGNQT